MYVHTHNVLMYTFQGYVYTHMEADNTYIYIYTPTHIGTHKSPLTHPYICIHVHIHIYT